jgi:hypothetical protein
MRFFAGYRKQKRSAVSCFTPYPIAAHSDGLRVLDWATNSSRCHLRKGAVTLATDDKECLMQPRPIVRAALDTLRRRQAKDTTKEDRVHAIISTFDL